MLLCPWWTNSAHCRSPRRANSAVAILTRSALRTHFERTVCRALLASPTRRTDQTACACRCYRPAPPTCGSGPNRSGHRQHRRAGSTRPAHRSRDRGFCPAARPSWTPPSSSMHPWPSSSGSWPASILPMPMPMPMPCRGTIRSRLPPARSGIASSTKPPAPGSRCKVCVLSYLTTSCGMAGVQQDVSRSAADPVGAAFLEPL